uniref:Uncharacterized protein n=1 Tax=Anguilla anguilla TaxID=7936 RepID=A0A0E9SV11_ANGAN
MLHVLSTKSWSRLNLRYFLFADREIRQARPREANTRHLVRFRGSLPGRV